MRIDNNYLKRTKVTIKDLLPEAWDLMYPFEEKGMYKKHFSCTFKYPKDSEYN
jgi:hypothetical protein